MLQKKQLLQNGSLKNPLTNHFCAGRRNSLRFFWILERCLYRTKLLIPLLKTKTVRISYLFFLWLLFSCQKNHEPVSKVSMPTHPNPEVAEEIAYGKELILHTSDFFGPKGSIARTSNGMNCTNCHLDAGTVDYGNNYRAVFANYPKFLERSGTLENLEKRINDCFQRSLNGDSLRSGSKELRSMVSYINFVGNDVPKNTVPKGSGIYKLKLLDQAADPKKGHKVYTDNCMRCHGENGEGSLSGGYSADYFEVPPLWGNESFNTSADLNRIINLAGFIYTNMPHKIASSKEPVLTQEEAWNVAAYIISKPRPQKFFKEDWPNLKTKPVDYAFGPFADDFSENQHRYGPFQPIIDFRKKNH